MPLTGMKVKGRAGSRMIVLDTVICITEVHFENRALHLWEPLVSDGGCNYAITDLSQQIKRSIPHPHSASVPDIIKNYLKIPMKKLCIKENRQI